MSTIITFFATGAVTGGGCVFGVGLNGQGNTLQVVGWIPKNSEAITSDNPPSLFECYAIGY